MSPDDEFRHCEQQLEGLFDHHAVRHNRRHEPSWLFRLRTNPEPIVFWTCMAVVGALIVLGVL